jgi:hypothetical protein
MALSEAEARRLADRFDRMLLQLVKDQVKALVAELRKARATVAGHLSLSAVDGEAMTWNSLRMQTLLQNIDITIADLQQRMSNVILLLPERATALADRYAGGMLQAGFWAPLGCSTGRR